MSSRRRFHGTGIAVLFFAAAISLSAQQPPSRDSSSARIDGILASLKSRLGIDPIECGRHPLPGRETPPASYADAVTASVRCVTDAAARQRPSWMLMQQQGIDSWVATGLVSDAGGVVRQFNYDGEHSGGSGATPTLSMRRCVTVSVTRRTGDVRLECSVPTDQR